MQKEKMIKVDPAKNSSGVADECPLPAQSQGLPMSRADYLLSYLAQECCEVAIRCTKAQHFGLSEIEPGQFLTNQDRIVFEFADVLAIVDVMREAGILPDMNALSPEIQARIREKKRKAASFRHYSYELGRLATVNVPE